MSPAVPQLLVVASGRERVTGAALGHGGWLPPEDREALDWLALARLSGWPASVGEPTAAASRWIVLARDPEELGSDEVDALRLRLDEPLVVVARAARPAHPLASLAGAARATANLEGRALEWRGPGPVARWSAREPVATALDATDCETWATLDGRPLVCARRVGAGVVVTLGFHPSRARDADGAVTAILRRALVHATPAPAAWLDLERTLVLRMDDPGGAQNVHANGWLYPKLGEREWQAVRAELRRRDARLSIAYTPGWVDDGDDGRGRLFVDGRPAAREAGAVLDSPRVRYEGANGNPHTSDYGSELRGIAALRAAGLGDVELHGHTHIHPDVAAWLHAPDQHDEIGWYREFGRPAAAAIGERGAGRHPLELGLAALRRIFGRRPTTFVPPGDQFHDADVETALRLGFSLVESYYLAIRDGDRFLWCQHVCAPYLDLASPDWLTAGLPVVGYFHDNDVSPGGVGWMRGHLDAWADAGVERMIDFRELAAALALDLDVREREGRPVLTVTSRPGAPRPVRPVPVRLAAADVGAEIDVEIDGVPGPRLTVRRDDGHLRAAIPTQAWSR